MFLLLLVIASLTIAACSEETQESSNEVVLKDSLLVAEPESDRKQTDLNQFAVVWGDENYDGAGDLDVTASIWSDSAFIHVQVDVVDDSVTHFSDPLHSDHVEIWFAPGRIETEGFEPYDMGVEGATDYIVWTDSLGNNEKLLWYRKTGDVDSFRVEIEDPVVALIRQDALGTISELLSDEDHRRTVEFIEWEEKFSDLRAGNFKSETIFYGLVHWGLFPDQRQAVLHDRKAYHIAEQQIGANIAVEKSKPEYSVTNTETGYRVSAKFSAEALGFVQKNGVQHIRVLVDVVDVDQRRRQETLMSSSVDREWGNPKSFNQLKLDPPIAVNLFPEVPWIGDPKAYREAPSIWNIPSLFMYSDEGWIGVRREQETWNYNHGLFPSNAVNISDLSFYRSPFSYFKDEVGDHVFEVFRFPVTYFMVGDRPYEDVILFNGKNLKVEGGDFGSDEYLSGFVFPDSVPGFLKITYGFLNGGCIQSGMCGCAMYDQLDVIRVGDQNIGSQKNLLDVDDCSNSISFADTSLEGHSLINKESIKWVEYGRRFEVDLGKWRVDYSWDESGGNVRYQIHEK